MCVCMCMYVYVQPVILILFIIIILFINFLTIYFDGSIAVKQSKASYRHVPGSTLGSSCFSLVFIENLVYIKSKYKTNILLFVYYYYCLQLSWVVIYNMYIVHCTSL